MQKIIDELSKIDVKERINEIKISLKETKSPTKINELVKELKILENLDRNNISPIDAFTREKVIIPPAVYRSPIELPNGTISIPDVNLLIKDISDISKTLGKAREAKLPKEDIDKIEVELYNSLNDMAGYDPPKHNRKAQHNIFTYLAGSGFPKGGFIQRKLVRKRQDLSGRSTLIPDPSLDIDQVKIPYEIAAEGYSPFLRRELKQRGFSADEIDKEVKNKSDATLKILNNFGKTRPILFNRAPSVRNTSVNAMYPIVTRDKTIGVPNLLAGLNSSLDFDGDSSLCYIHLRVPSHLRLIKKLDKLLSFLYSVLRINKQE